MITGTSYFVSTRDAERYYKPYGFTPDDVRRKAASGEIHIGIKPPAVLGLRQFVNVEEGRYFIEHDDPPPPPVQTLPTSFTAYAERVHDSIERPPPIKKSARLTKMQRILLLQLREAATFKNASFNSVHGPEMIRTDQIKERTRLYRDTWIIGRIDALLEGTEREWK